MKHSKLILLITLLALLTIVVQVAISAEPCSFDFDNDGDVDGKDLSLFSQQTNPTPQNYLDLTMQFGKTDCFILPAPEITLAANPQITNGVTVSTLSWTVPYADSINIEPGPGDVTGTSSVGVAPALTTEYTLTAIGRGGSNQSKITVSVDTVPPVIVSFYPFDNSVIATNAASISMLGTFGDNLSGIKSVILRDEENTDITSSATVTGSTIEYVIPLPQEKTYRFTITLEDNVSNIMTYPVTFRVDNTIPVTTPSVSQGRFASPISLNLTASEEAIIYYSIDGYPPFVGAGNTLSSPSPVSGIMITDTTRLQFFAVDTAGNTETTQKVDYQFSNIIAPVTGLNANYSQPPKQIYLSWNQKVDIQHYNIYRCMNIADYIILQDSKENGYPPPKRLKINNTTGNIANYTDLVDLVEGASYYYGVTYVDSNGVESVICDLVQETITAQTYSLTKEEAIDRSIAWLQNHQKSNGSWDENPGQILATSQALNGLKLANVQNAGSYYGLFYLRGSKADNTDYLSRKILTLFNHGQNVDESVNLLISNSFIYGTQIQGWGITPLFSTDALDTALGTKALACLSIDLTDADGTPLVDVGKFALAQLGALQGPEIHKYGWVPGKDISAFVSAVVYSVTTPAASTTAWLTNLQQANGSFESNIIDTAAVLIWQPDIILDKALAQQYIVTTQLINGSWGNDPYLTGLCLEALLK